jgi:hypothetical protein
VNPSVFGSSPSRSNCLGKLAESRTPTSTEKEVRNMAKERDDYSGPIENVVRYEEFSKEFLLKLMKIWREHYDDVVTNLVLVGSQMEGIGSEKALDLEVKTIEAVTPPTMAKIAELAKCDINTMEGRCKAGQLTVDNVPDRYRGHWEVKSDKEVLLVLDHCRVFHMMRAVGDLPTLRKICLESDPRYVEIMHTYPDHPRKAKVTMLKVPETLDPPPDGEPICIWRFVFEE